MILEQRLGYQVTVIRTNKRLTEVELEEIKRETEFKREIKRN